MSNEENMITTDNPLNKVQQEKLASLLDVIIPPSNDGRLPSAAEVDLITYLQTHAADFMPALVQTVEDLDDQFTTLERSERYPIVEELSTTSAAVFGMILFHVYACYYQDDRVHQAIGMESGPPFPRGNTVETGDLSLLDPVMERPSMYRRT